MWGMTTAAACVLGLGSPGPPSFQRLIPSLSSRFSTPDIKTKCAPRLHRQVGAMVSKLLSTITLALLLGALASLSVPSTRAATAACDPASCTSQPSGVATQVCDSNGVAYSSQCEFELAKCASPQLQLAAQGSCIAKCDQECGSDGVTYLNACHFDRAYCKDPTLTPLGYGACATSNFRRSTSTSTSLSV